MKCLNCGNEIENGGKFCQVCGTEAQINYGQVCPKCSSVLEHDASFCAVCGYNLTGNLTSFDNNRQPCPYCGNLLNSEEKFCGKCGNSVNQTLPNTSSKAAGKKNTGFIILISVLVAAIICLTVAIFFIINRNSSDRSIAPEPNEKIYSENKVVEKPKKEEKSEEKLKTKEDKEELHEKKAIDNEEDNQEIYEMYPSDVPENKPNKTYLFPSDKVYITDSDLYGKSKEEVALIRNEIYARHGYIFNSEPFKTYFSQKDWYVPNSEFSDSSFSKVEKANVDFIVAYEKDRGWR